LATYYVDDKALRPDEFVNLRVERLKNGMSGASVERRNNIVYKTHHDSKLAARWYDIAKTLVRVPVVHSLIGNTIALEYIQPSGMDPRLKTVLLRSGNV
jgi:hypothetical protein